MAARARGSKSPALVALRLVAGTLAAARELTAGCLDVLPPALAHCHPHVLSMNCLKKGLCCLFGGGLEVCAREGIEGNQIHFAAEVRNQPHQLSGMLQLIIDASHQKCFVCRLPVFLT